MTRYTRYALVALALAVVMTPGCEDSGVIAPDDATIAVTASPATVSIDTPQTQGVATINAVLRDANGVPREGIAVTFSASAGILASVQNGTAGVVTNSNGVAQDVLTVRDTDPASIEVKATSGTISGTATVAVAVGCFSNPAPVAVIAGGDSLPLFGTAGTHLPATLDGSSSYDPGGGAIAAYVWNCGNGQLPVPVGGTDNARVVCTYTVLSETHTYTATLTVKDNGTGVGFPCQRTSPEVSVSVVVTPTAAGGS